MKTIYHCDPTTGVFTATGIADESPLERDVYLIPAHATDLPPPATGDGEQAFLRDGVWIVTLQSPTPAPVEPQSPATKPLPDYLADRRWQTEVGGTAWNGWTLPTDERSQSKYQAELLAATAGVRGDGDPWKFPHGFEALTNDQVRSMAFAARAHILACYALEAALLADIDQGRITSAAEIDAAFAAMGA